MALSVIRDSGFQGQEIIVIGGGTDRFTDRPTILGADYAYTPIYREIATFRVPSDGNVQGIKATLTS